MIQDGGGGGGFSLDVEPGSVHDASASVTSLAKGLDVEQGNLSRLADGLAPVWRGANAEAIGGSVRQLSQRIGHGADRLTDAATALTTLATDYEHAKTQVARLEQRRQDAENTLTTALAQHAQQLANARTSPAVGPPTPGETSHDATAAQTAQRLDSGAMAERDRVVSALIQQYVELVEHVQAQTRTAGRALDAAVLLTVPAGGEPGGDGGDEDPTEWADKLNRLLGFPLSPIAVGLAGPEGRAIAGLAGALRNSHGLPTALQALFSKMVGPAGLAFDRGEVPLADLVAASARYEEVAAGITGDTADALADATKLAKLGGLPEMPIFDAAGRVIGVVAIGSDVLTLINPGADGAEGDVNRAMAGANIAGTAAFLLAANASVDWIPVAGQVVAVISGVYLAGDWAYHNTKWFHSAVDDTVHGVVTGVKGAAHGIAVGATATYHGVGTAIHYAEPWHW